MNKNLIVIVLLLVVFFLTYLLYSNSENSNKLISEKDEKISLLENTRSELQRDVEQCNDRTENVAYSITDAVVEECTTIAKEEYERGFNDGKSDQPVMRYIPFNERN